MWRKKSQHSHTPKRLYAKCLIFYAYTHNLVALSVFLSRKPLHECDSKFVPWICVNACAFRNINWYMYEIFSGPSVRPTSEPELVQVRKINETPKQWHLNNCPRWFNETLLDFLFIWIFARFDCYFASAYKIRINIVFLFSSEWERGTSINGIYHEFSSAPEPNWKWAAKNSEGLTCAYMYVYVYQNRIENRK